MSDEISGGKPTRLLHREQKTKPADSDGSNPSADFATKPLDRSEDDGFRTVPGSHNKAVPPTPPLPPVEPVQDARRTTLLRAPESAQEHTWEPVCGWLVIVKGPGSGQAMSISYKTHAIGRDKDQNICIDFGDGSITRKEHAYITYEPRSRKFSIRKGKSYVYVNGEDFTEHQKELSSGDMISLSPNDTTMMRFIAFCDDKFDWIADQEDD